MKNMIKEAFILILMFVAIFLLLEIVLYGYNPSSKIVPNNIEYATPDEVKEEIGSTELEEATPVVITYEIDQTQINNSKQSGSLDSGKQNPFAKPRSKSSEKNDEDDEYTEDDGTTDDELDTDDEETTSSESKGSNGSSSKSYTESGGNGSSKTTTNETHYLPNSGTK